MSLSTQPYKGARDFYPQDKRLQKYMFAKLRQVVESFGYQEYDAPILESFELYAAKSGEEIINDQLYSFEDRKGRKVAIRPEMTPSVSRMVAARRQELAYPLRLYSIPNLWRYERPQAGRLREHWQLNVDLFGVEGIEGDAEVIQVADVVLKSLGAEPGSYQINVNSRVAMVKAMHSFGLSEAELKEAYKLVDKMPKLDKSDFDNLLTEQIGQDRSQKLRDYLENDSPPDNVSELLKLLEHSGVTSAVYEPSVVRGLEYYTDVVFEVFDKSSENARALFGGGRYDGLVELFGVEPVATVGFGMGDVTLQRFLEIHNLLPELKSETDAVAILIGDLFDRAQPALAQLRSKGLNIAVDSTDRKIDSRIKHAEKQGVSYVIFLGEEELNNHEFKLKNLTNGEERTLSADDLAQAIS
jgi:histidyl-tRNA synthetase